MTELQVHVIETAVQAAILFCTIIGVALRVERRFTRLETKLEAHDKRQVQVETKIDVLMRRR